jgi:hypothetical protein
MRLQSEAPAKKPYKPPKLFVYGDLTQMTLAHGKTGSPDGAKKGSNRFTGK